MSSEIDQLAQQSGVSPDQARNGLGAILNELKGKLPADAFSKLQGAIPGAGGMMESVAKSFGGGIFGMLIKMVGGGGLLATLAKIGLNPAQIQAFLPKVIEMLQRILPADLLAKVMNALPGLKNATEPTQR